MASRCCEDEYKVMGLSCLRLIWNGDIILALYIGGAVIAWLGLSSSCTPGQQVQVNIAKADRKQRW